MDRIFLSNPKLASHLTVFGENVALSESLNWLKELKFKKLEKGPEGKAVEAPDALPSRPLSAAQGAARDALRTAE